MASTTQRPLKKKLCHLPSLSIRHRRRFLHRRLPQTTLTRLCHPPLTKTLLMLEPPHLSSRLSNFPKRKFARAALLSRRTARRLPSRGLSLGPGLD
jgi:hypothetical protein